MPELRPQITAKCPECEKGELVAQLVDETFDFDLGEETIEVHAKNVPVERCTNCGAELSGPPAAKVRHEAVCKAAGFFTPEEVKALRKQLDLSQEELARLGGMGVATVSGIERGRRIQNRSTDNLFYLIAQSEEARRLLAERLAQRARKRSEPTAGQGGAPVVKTSTGNGNQPPLSISAGKQAGSG